MATLDDIREALAKVRELKGDLDPNDNPDDSESDPINNNPRFSHEMEATVMVPQCTLAMYSFSNDASYLHLGIGAAFAGDCGGFSRAIASEQQEGFALAMKHTPCHPIIGILPPPVTNIFETFQKTGAIVSVS